MIRDENMRIHKRLDLRNFERPSRYGGGEWNAVVKKEGVLCRILLAFPDVYEIGMSHLGLRILYGVVNAHEKLAAERAFAPWMDMEAGMREIQEPLRSLETGIPAADFDLIGFSLQHELNYTNVLNMLDLAGLPVRANDRGEDSPIVIAGGPGAFNPEPLVPFFDIFVIGDAEELLPELMLRYGEMREGGASKTVILKQLSELTGVYTPALYDTKVDPQTKLIGVRPPGKRIPFVKKAVLANLDNFSFPAQLVVPYCEIVHDRAFVEIARGCSRGCRFCQAGVIYMPERRRRPQQVAETVMRMLEATGYGDLSLSSLTPNDYRGLKELVTALMSRLRPEGISLSLASLSPRGLDESLLELIKGVRKTGVTLAPEAGTGRLRDVINKGITEEEVLASARAAFKLGWKLIKLYFMIGLPTETEEDVKGIAELAGSVAGLEKGIKVNVGVSNFVPKPHTPFQWAPMETEANLRSRQSDLRKWLARSRVQVKMHNVKGSLLEGVIARGDRRVGEAVEAAWRLGCRFDSWRDRFKPDLWERAFEEVGINTADYLHKRLPTDSILPWSHIDPGVRTGFLKAELQRALEGKPTIRCNPRHCAECGVCEPDLLKERWMDVPPERYEVYLPELEETVEQSQRIRFCFRKSGNIRLLSHLDLVRLMARIFRRAGITVELTKGFHPTQRISFGPALPLGIEGLNEYIDALVVNPKNLEGMIESLNSVSPEGLRFRNAVHVGKTEQSLGADIVAASYLITRLDGRKMEMGNVESFLSKGRVEWVRERKGKERRFDLRKSVLELQVRDPGSVLRMVLSLENHPQAKAYEVVEAVFSLDAGEIEVIREQLFVRRGGELRPPM